MKTASSIKEKKKQKTGQVIKTSEDRGKHIVFIMVLDDSPALGFVQVAETLGASALLFEK